MCGIAGYVCTDKYEPKLDVAFPLMGVFMEDRGNQSWGYTNGQRIYKAVGELQEGWTPDMTGALQAALHTRYATTGAITSENSHPWDFGDGFIGMHNGVIDNDWQLISKHKLPKYEVDSQTLLHYIKNRMDLTEVEGYGAVVFWRDGKVWLGRFNGGDLYIAKTEFGVVFASTEWAIDNALSMAGLPKAMHYQVDNEALYFIDKGQLFISDEKLNVGKRTAKTTWQNFATPSDLASLEKSYGVKLRDNTPTDLKISYGVGDCAWCGSGSKDLFDTRDGALCEGCARYAETGVDETPVVKVTVNNIEAEAARNAGLVTPSGPVEACCERNSFGIHCDCDREERARLCEAVEEFDQRYHCMTVREWDQSKEAEDLPIDHPSMTSCDECGVTLVADDDLFLDEDASGGVEIVICTECHTEKENEAYDTESRFEDGLTSSRTWLT